jgi:phage terminase large subunit-like protein
VIKQREIEYRKLGGRLRVLSADADTGDGIIPSFVAADELHRASSGEAYGLLRDSLGKRGGTLIGIST